MKILAGTAPMHQKENPVADMLKLPHFPHKQGLCTRNVVRY